MLFENGDFMPTEKARRRKKRRPTLTPRFGPSSVALEIGLIRQSLDVTADSDLQVKKKEQGS